MPPVLDPNFVAACGALCGFRAIAPVVARKAQLLAGEVDGRAAIAKRVARDHVDGLELPPNPVWAWYFAREVAVYRAFAARPPALRVPQLIAASDELLVIERLPGAPIARRRRPHAACTPALVEALIATGPALAAWDGTLPALPPPPEVRAQLRSRLLEDPTAPFAWITGGLARAAARGLVDDALATRAVAAVEAYPATALRHGDLLLRNAIGDGDRIGLVDWECAGTYAADWDLALLSTQLAADGRARIEAQLAGDRRRAFFALTVFALVRELAFLDAFRQPADAPARVDLHRELARADELLR